MERWSCRTRPTGVRVPIAAAAQASFLATERGTADLTAMTDFTCLHSHPACEPPQRLWQVRVVVR